MPNVCHHGLSSVYFLERGTRLIWNSTEPKFVPFRFFWHPWHPWGRIHIDLKKILSNPAVSADFYPLGSGFPYFFWLGCLEILLLSMPKSMEAITVQKSKNATWYLFLIFFPKTPLDQVKMVFIHLTNASNIITFLMKNSYPKNFGSLDFQISLVCTSFSRLYTGCLIVLRSKVSKWLWMVEGSLILMNYGP